MPLDEAIAIPKQIAEALEAGHEAGVIHRDLKPGNIKLKEDGTVYQVTVSLNPGFSWETPKRLWDSALPVDRDGAPSYTLTPDGNRFLLAKPQRIDEFRVVFNWHEELKRLVPTEN